MFGTSIVADRFLVSVESAPTYRGVRVDPTFRILLFKNQEMLPREIGFVFDEGEAEGFEFFGGLSGGHFVESLDGDSGVLGAEF